MKTSRGAFTLVELMVVVTIIGLLAALVIVRYVGRTDQANVTAARAQLAQIEAAVTAFQAQNGRLPRAIEELVERPPGLPRWPEGGYFRGRALPKDPWGRDFLYRVNGETFEVISLGGDGVEGGTRVDADLSSSDPEPVR